MKKKNLAILSVGVLLCFTGLQFIEAYQMVDSILFTDESLPEYLKNTTILFGSGFLIIGVSMLLYILAIKDSFQ